MEPAVPGAAGYVRPFQRARRLRRGLCGPCQRPEESRHRRAGFVDPKEPGSPRCRRCRSAAGRWRRNSHPDTRPVLSGRNGQAGCCPAPAGRIRRGYGFLPQEAASRHACVEEIERSIKAEGQVVLGWREVPVNRDMPMSPTVKAKEPVIRQVFVGRGPDVFVTDALERKLFIIRRRSANAIKS